MIVPTTPNADTSIIAIYITILSPVFGELLVFVSPPVVVPFVVLSVVFVVSVVVLSPVVVFVSSSVVSAGVFAFAIVKFVSAFL